MADQEIIDLNINIEMIAFHILWDIREFLPLENAHGCKVQRGNARGAFDKDLLDMAFAIKANMYRGCALKLLAHRIIRIKNMLTNPRIKLSPIVRANTFNRTAAGIRRINFAINT
ncbi:hypothetical protein RF55_12229 [Lasius niger]|uniref:Uncharacterized protein n=1 Tax=Lasius niger TaxID=67767 RepID=A0A0J7KCX6_LASNI|nr:hypothetical protein RF55_12229 [Lasius niger]